MDAAQKGIFKIPAHQFVMSLNVESSADNLKVVNLKITMHVHLLETYHKHKFWFMQSYF